MNDSRRISLNVRVDPDKHAILEEARKTGSGIAQTTRNRSDVYNEYIGLGVMVAQLKQRLGEVNFERVWRLLLKVDWEKVRIEGVEKFVEKFVAK